MKLVRYDAAKAALAAVVKIDEVKDIKDKATAMEVYAYQARDPDLASHSVEVKKRAVRRLGELMEEGPKAKAGGDMRPEPPRLRHKFAGSEPNGDLLHGAARTAWAREPRMHEASPA